MFFLASRRKRAKSQSRESLLQEAQALLDAKSKKKKKPSLFQFSTDPVTGKRNNKGTYSKERYLAQKGK